MTKRDKKLYLFYLNEKANAASSMMHNSTNEKKKEFYYGNYMAFVEMTSFTNNIHAEDETH